MSVASARSRVASPLDATDFQRMTVPALKASLASRGLDTSGLKGELVERLEHATHPKNRKRRAGDISGSIEDDSSHCPICFDWFRGEIFQCEEGHMVCATCKPSLPQDLCPTCRVPMGRIRARGAENILSKVTMPCRWKDAGCDKLATKTDRESHEKRCAFYQYWCPFDCDHACGKDEMTDHIEEEHCRCSGMELVQMSHTKLNRLIRARHPWHKTQETQSSCFTVPVRRRNSCFYVQFHIKHMYLHIRAVALFNPGNYKHLQVTFPYVVGGYEHSVVIPIEKAPSDDSGVVNRKYVEDVVSARGYRESAAKLHVSTFETDASADGTYQYQIYFS